MGKYVILGITVKLMSIELPILAEVFLSYPEWLDRRSGPSPGLPRDPSAHLVPSRGQS